MSKNAPAASEANNSLFNKLPPQYYNYALQWAMYDKWTVEEAANLLCACVPHRKMLTQGKANESLDLEILSIENRIRRALGNGLELIKDKKYFSTRYIDRRTLINWAKRNHIVVPFELTKAQEVCEQHTQLKGYTTPSLDALQWVIDNFWQNADLRNPPSHVEIVQALLGQFPQLSSEACDRIEAVCRHPYAESKH